MAQFRFSESSSFSPSAKAGGNNQVAVISGDEHYANSGMIPSKKALLASVLSGLSVSRAPQDASRLCSGMRSILQHLNSIDEYVSHTHGILFRLFECGQILNSCRI